MTDILRQQYALVKSSRSSLLGYCSAIDETLLVRDSEIFGRGSMRNLLVHVANVYEYWVRNLALKQTSSFSKYESYERVSEIENLYDKVNITVEDFLQQFNNKWEDPLELRIERVEKVVKVTPLEIFTHVITHEFHHKGQILSLSRTLGFTPIDTDIIRF